VIRGPYAARGLLFGSPRTIIERDDLQISVLMKWYFVSLEVFKEELETNVLLIDILGI